MRRSLPIRVYSLLAVVLPMLLTFSHAIADQDEYELVGDVVIRRSTTADPHVTQRATIQKKIHTMRVILIDTPKKSALATSDEIDYLFRRAPDSVVKRLEEISRGEIKLIVDSDGDGKTDVLGPYLYEGESVGCPYRKMSNEIEERYYTEIHSLPTVDHTLYIMPRDTKCDFGGRGELGGDESWYQTANIRVFLHELGHNLGLMHGSSSWPGNIADEYGDPQCIMGSGEMDYNAPHLYQLGLLNASEVISIPYPESRDEEQLFTLSSITTRKTSPDLPYAIVINHAASNRKLMLSVQTLDEDSFEPTEIGNWYKHQLRAQVPYLRIHRMPTRPELNTDLLSSLFTAQSFIDPEGNLEITFKSATPSSVTFSLRLIDANDYDHDAVADTEDSDDDNDGIPDTEDCEPRFFQPNALVFEDNDLDGLYGAGDHLSKREAPNMCVQSPYLVPYNESAPLDNCSRRYNPEQLPGTAIESGLVCDEITDSDGDGVTNSADCAPFDASKWKNFEVWNLYSDVDGDGLSDRIHHLPNKICAGETLPMDVIPNGFRSSVKFDNCPTVANPSQRDSDGDGLGDECDDDRDGDYLPNDNDCEPDNKSDRPLRFYPDQDGDGLMDSIERVAITCNDPISLDRYKARSGRFDNCPLVFNPDQRDLENDGVGDACQGNDDGDSLPNENDCDPTRISDRPRQFYGDSDRDGFVDSAQPLALSCSDVVPVGAVKKVTAIDNCPTVANPSQADRDTNGIGDQCDRSTIPDATVVKVAELQQQLKELGRARRSRTFTLLYESVKAGSEAIVNELHHIRETSIATTENVVTQLGKSLEGAIKQLRKKKRKVRRNRKLYDKAIRELKATLKRVRAVG